MGEYDFKLGQIIRYEAGGGYKNTACIIREPNPGESTLLVLGLQENKFEAGQDYNEFISNMWKAISKKSLNIPDIMEAPIWFDYVVRLLSSEISKPAENYDFKLASALRGMTPALVVSEDSTGMKYHLAGGRLKSKSNKADGPIVIGPALLDADEIKLNDSKAKEYDRDLGYIVSVKSDDKGILNVLFSDAPTGKYFNLYGTGIAPLVIKGDTLTYFDPEQEKVHRKKHTINILTAKEIEKSQVFTVIP